MGDGAIAALNSALAPVAAGSVDDPAELAEGERLPETFFVVESVSIAEICCECLRVPKDQPCLNLLFTSVTTSLPDLARVHQPMSSDFKEFHSNHWAFYNG